MSMQSKQQKQILCALFAALTAVFSQIALPVGPVPVTLGTLAVLMSGALLGKKYGMISMGLYLLLGAIGLPVFSLFRAGLGTLLSPGGGFIIGFALAAGIVGAIVDKKGDSFKTLILAMIAGNLGCYVLGLIWFIGLTQVPLWNALLLCFFPFLLGDGIKIVLGAFLVGKLKKTQINRH